jgi:autotransporter-associated beta strand protein
VTTGIGENGYDRVVSGQSFAAGTGTLTLGGEVNTYDGPWDVSEDFLRWNGFARWFTGDDKNFTSITAMAGATDWNSSDQIPRRAVTNGTIGRFGTLDPTTGGESQRHSLQFQHQFSDPTTITRLSAYGIYYDLDLFSNFTYFTSGANGDQFQQIESRFVFGGELTRTWLDRQVFGKPTDITAGFQTRNDTIDDIALNQTNRRQFVSNVRQDDVFEGSYSLFGDATTRWTDTIRTIAGLRADLFTFDVQSNLAANTGDKWDGIVSPKLGLVFGPYDKTEYYLNFGTGFHSNDARGVNTTVDPSTTPPTPVAQVDPLVRTIGGEVGVRTSAINNLTSTLTLWWLDSDSELVYVGDAGTNEAGPASRRIGIEWANYWRPTDWFATDCEVSLSHARFRDSGAADYVPNSIPAMISGGISLGREEGWFGGLRVRAFAGRPLDETGDIEGKTTLSLNGRVGYRQHDWEVSLDCLNILDRKDNDIEYYYESQLSTEAAAVADTHFHPAEPRMVRLSATYRF